MENQKKNSDAKIRANAKYTKSHYTQIKINAKPDKAEKIKGYAEENNHSIASFIIKACDYIIDNNIKLE